MQSPLRLYGALALAMLVGCDDPGGTRADTTPGDARVADGGDASDAALADVALADGAPDVGPPPCGPELAFADPQNAADDAHWLDRPWPADTRLRDGHPDLDETPLPDNGLLAPYRAVAATLDGFGLNSAAYVRFDGALDPLSLPGAADSLAPDSPVQMAVYSGPDAGRRIPLELGIPAADDRWVDGRTLMARPVPGFVLPEDAIVCVAYTDGLRGLDGCPARAPPGFRAALGDDPSLAPLAAAPPPGLIGGTCYTTRTIGALDATLAHARAEPAPTVRVFDEKLRGGPARRILRVEYDAPVYQAGEAPWSDLGSGRLVFVDGEPVARRVPTAALLVVPDVEPPAGVWPVVQYASGTGGPMTVCPSIARQAWDSGHAVICVDRPGLGERGDGTEPPWPDFRNPFASLGTMAQEVVDHMTLSRVVAAIAAGDVAPGGAELPPLAPSAPALFGFSQGALMAGIAAGVLPELDAVLIDSGGGLAIEGALARPDSAELVGLFAPVLGIHPDNLDGLHPAVAVLQMLADEVDPINFADRWLGPDLPDVLVLSGTRDTKTLTRFANALTAAARVPLAAPVLEPSPGHQALGLDPVALPVRGNVDGKTAVLIQIDGNHGLRGELGETMDHWLRSRLDGAAEAR